MRIKHPIRVAGLLGIAAGTILAPVGYAMGVGNGNGGVVLTASADDRAEALAVLESDKAFQSVLQGGHFTVVEAGPWTDSTGTVLIGTAMRLRLDDPLTTAGTWPGVVHHGHRGKGYAKGEHRLKVKDVSRLDVLVDLTTGAVAGIEPGPGSGTVISLDGAAVTEPLPEPEGTDR